MLDVAGDLHAAVSAKGSLAIGPEWEGIPGSTFGGFVAGATLVAGGRESQHPRPLSLHCRYHRPVPPGRSVGLAVEVERRGRIVDTLTAMITDDDRLLAAVSMAFGNETDHELDAMAVPVPDPPGETRSVHEMLAENGIESGPMMRRVGFRGTVDEQPPVGTTDWHLVAEWPDPGPVDRVSRAAVAAMMIDCWVAPATMRAVGVDLNSPWPVVVPSVDLAAWFYDDTAAASNGWLVGRVSVPIASGGFAVGRTQVWADDVLVAEGMSQVALVPVPE